MSQLDQNDFDRDEHEDWREDEGDWSWSEEEGDDASETIRCAHCGVEVYEDAPRCPVCNEDPATARGAFAGRPAWWIGVGVLLLAAIVFAFVLR